MRVVFFMMTSLLNSDAAAEQGRTKAGELCHLHPADVHGEGRAAAAQVHRQQRGRSRGHRRRSVTFY